MDFNKIMAIAVSGLTAQGTRARVIAENIANADSLPESPGGQPYQRKTITFVNALDRELGVNTVRVKDISPDPSPPQKRFDPKHPMADEDGYVLAPNVNSLLEIMDLREAQRTYQANLRVIDSARRMASQTLELLR